MKEHYSVVLMYDEYNCAVKQISKNTYDQIKGMQKRGESDETIIKSLTEINTMEDNIVINGATLDMAEKCAQDEGQDYVVLQAFRS
ncbi:hypothetical protein M2651_10625 [Clostridium sp. SYSU_GA19001]|uniref:hypothetical protein n=1 Tax=Clostridium caldaquaticum TaxID=2940653 RepID=UPI002077975D|nr:hypothetical protein [Clostridium caldaquaticum]MCM8711475.1 hypothetical protein [Clostridium caldaquaticum]